MVHFWANWSILEKRTEVNYEVKPKDTTIQDIHNLSSTLGEPKHTRRALLKYFGGNFKFKVETRLKRLTHTICLLAYTPKI